MIVGNLTGPGPSGGRALLVLVEEVDVGIVEVSVVEDVNMDGESDDSVPGVVRVLSCVDVAITPETESVAVAGPTGIGQRTQRRSL